MVNQKYLDKAEVLIEALPYIQRFNRKIVVIKYGGSAMLDEELKRNVIKDAVLLKLVGFKPIIVHGGGKEISRWVGKVGMEPRFVNGLRVTDKDTMEIAEMVLAKVNKELVTLVESLGVQAVGVSGKDGGLLQCKKKLSKGEDIGYVGEVTKVNPKILQDLLERDFLPIVFPIGFDENFDSYNINADDAACAIAEAVNAEKLAFLSDIEGVYRDASDPSTLISELRVDEAENLISDGTVGGGMIPTYLVVKNMQLLNTIWALVLPGCLSVYNMIVARTFFKSNISEELYEAGEIDGCTQSRFFFQIALPLSKAIIAIMVLYYGVGHWNSYFSALLYISDQDKYPLQLVLRNILITNQTALSQTATTAAARAALQEQQQLIDVMKYSLIIISSVPVLIMYPLVQKHFVKGVMIGSVKG